MLTETVKADAIEWSKENGLKGNLRSNVYVTDIGFRVEVESDNGSSSICTYRSNGTRSMYELAKGRGM